MKHIFLLLISACFSLSAGAQGTWTTKQAIFNGCYTQSNAHFAIGDKGYIGMGPDFCSDWWEYDPAADTYLLKASFPDTTMSNATVFTLGGYGYVLSQGNRLWKYDPAGNTWVNTWADFPGVPRLGAYYFSIGTKGYMGGGIDPGSGALKDFWEYNSVSNQWTRLADLIQADGLGEGFALNGKGYISGGSVSTGLSQFSRKVYAYDPGADTWTMKANLPDGRFAGSAFVLGQDAYIGMGIVSDTTGGFDDPFIKVWKYDHLADSWSRAADIPLLQIYDEGIGFSINGKGYFGLGDCNGSVDVTCSGGVQRKIFEYTSATTGINAVNASPDISIYPNPSSGQFTISVYAGTSVLKQARLIICNTLGKEVHRSLIDPHPTIIDFSGASGLYFYTIMIEDETITKGKILIE